MAEIKTPFELVTERLTAITTNGKMPFAISGERARDEMILAIEADRAQLADQKLDVDGGLMDPIMLAIAEALEDRGDDRSKRAAAAVRNEGGFAEVIFDSYVEGLLTTVARVYGTEEKVCGRCDDTVDYVDSDGRCDTCVKELGAEEAATIEATMKIEREARS